MIIQKTIAAAAVAFLALSSAALADGNLCGTVTANGQPLAAATVTAESASQKLAVITGANGTYCMTALNSNAHVVRVEKLGFNTIVSGSFTPISENTLRLNFRTRPGNRTERMLGQMPRPNAASTLTADVYFAH